MASETEHQHTSPKDSHGKELQETLRKLLSIGRLVITPEWNYLADDWVTCVSAADIDDDGDIEVIAGSRDGYVRALSRQGTERWKERIGPWITSIAIVPSLSIQDLGEDPNSSLSLPTNPLSRDPNKSRPRVIVSTRDGQVCALNRDGKLVKWDNQIEQTKSGLAIHQIAIHPKSPNEVVVGGEDGFVRLLDPFTGKEWGKYDLGCRVYGVCVADVDGDNHNEILAVSADKYIHILSRQVTSNGSIDLTERGKIKLQYKSYTLAVAEQDAGISGNSRESPPSQKRSAIILSSDNGKDLRGWTVAHQTRGPDQSQLTFNKTKLPRSPHLHTLRGRVLTIHTADVNNDGQLETLVGSADHFLYIFDQRGQLLWRQDFGQNIYSIYARDYDEDGIIEIITGMGDNNIRAFKIELNPERYEPSILLASDTDTQLHTTRPSLYLQIQKVVERLRRLNTKELPITLGDAFAELLNNLGLLRDEQPKQEKREFAVARLKLEQNKYEEALSIFSRLKEQRVQHYWDEPLVNLGHIRDLGFGDVKGNPIDEIIVGTDEGELIALDINNEKKELWNPRAQTFSSVVSLSTSNPHPERDYETTLVVLENGHLGYINNDGYAIELPAHLLEPGDCVTSLYVKNSATPSSHQIEYIALALESRQICLYNAAREQRQAMIPTDESITMLYAGDILGQQLAILAATARHAVILYVQDKEDPTHYTKCWRYQTQDRIRGLCAADIDRDGHIEIVIGSEDRNLYVLNHLGELKWRYFMPDGIFSVDVCDIDHDKRGEYEILAGVDDGFVYILDCRGDLLLQIPIGDRVRVVRAKDLHPQNPQDPYDHYLRDDMVEIAVATDDRLMLFQYLSPDQIEEQIKRSWYFVRNNVGLRDILYTYSDYQKQPNEYVRAFALNRLAGQRKHTDDDFKHLRTAIAKDPSILVSQGLARAIVDLCRNSSGDRDIRQSRQLLQQLARKPHRQTRIAIIDMLDELAKVNKKLSFEYLRRFLRNEDLWLRRMVIRRLYNLISLDPRQVFSLLMTSVHDKNLWIRQEIGRCLAHYFDYRCKHSADQYTPPANANSDLTLSQSQTLLQDLHELLSTGLDVVTIKQIATSSEEPAIKQLFASYACFQEAISTKLDNSPLDNSLESLQQHANFKVFLEQKKGYQDALTTFVTDLQSTMQLMPQVEDMLVIYQELANVLQVTSIDDIEQLRRKTKSEEMHAFSRFKDIDATLNRLPEVVDEVKRYRKRQALGDQAATLLEAIYLLIQIRHQYIEDRSAHSTAELLPEDTLFRIALQQWYVLLQQELRKLSGAAQLSIELLPNEVLHDETVELSFKLTNTGKSAADAVRISIPENPSDYEVIGSPERSLPQVSTLHAQTVSFLLKPLKENFRLPTQVIYNDAGKRNRLLQQGHFINLKPLRSDFKEIVNPYHGGTPTSNAKMFYGREEDLQSISQTLSSTSANRIILLIGQRRSGKTSLLYQLENRLQPHMVVHIDMQSLALSSNAAELFSNFSRKIHETMLTRGFSAPLLNELNFCENPTETFNSYLKLSIQELGGQRLILLIDEFEVFTQLIQQKRLDENFMHYLRSLMQHQPGMNFLLAGAPHLLLHDPNDRSALPNIAQQHRLSSLKQEEATALIIEPVQNLTYDPLALELIHQLTGNQPYLIHLLCEELIYACNKHHKNYVNTNDINKIIDKVLERGDNYFWMIWKLASSLEERLIFALLSGEVDEGQGKIFSLADLKKAFSDLNCPYKTENVRKALDHLKQEEIIEEDNHGQLFSIPVDLIRIWLHQHTTANRIARDEFTTE